jgi:hypothetical protein
VGLAKVSRDARQILNELRAKSGQEPTIEDVFEAEQLVYSYYAKTVVGHIKRMYNPNSKSDPARVAFYVRPTRSLNKGRRNKDDWLMTEEEKRVYWEVCSYLIEDFNYDALKLLREICQRKLDIVREAIEISEAEDVRSIPYLYRVLEGLEARKEHERRQIEERRRLFLQEQNKQTIKRGRLEIASLMHEWQETIQNMELQKKVDKLRR